jgi:hypothetical protein
VRGQVQEADFTAKDALYQAAKYALLDDAKSCFSILPEVFSSKKLDAERLATWPIFREMRKSPLYQDFLRAHGPKLDERPDGKLLKDAALPQLTVGDESAGEPT